MELFVEMFNLFVLLTNSCEDIPIKTKRNDFINKLINCNKSRFFLHLFLLLCFLIISFSQVRLVYPASLDHIIIDWTYVSDKHSNVGVCQLVGFHLTWSINGSNVQGATVFINSKPYEIENNGFVFCMDSKAEVGKKEWSIDKIIYANNQIPFEYIVEKPFCIFDKVLINLENSTKRISIGARANITYTARYAYDNAPFNGQIILNNSIISYSTVGHHGYTVDEIIDDNYGLTLFESNCVEVIWDSVKITLNAIKTRIAVGSKADIHCYAHYKYDNSYLDGDIIFNDTVHKQEVGKYCFSVASIQDDKYNVSHFSSNNVQIIFDEIIIRLEVDDNRINIGEKANISRTAKYAYDSKPFTGRVTLNDIILTYNKVGRHEYSVRSIFDPIFHLNSFSSNSVGVIWDRVKIELKTEDERINVGEEAKIWWEGVYEYDESDFREFGKVTLNSSQFQRTTIGSINYEVSDIVDDRYGLTNFTYNTLTLIWDRVNINLGFSQNRTQVSTKTNPNINGVYEYDETVFKGTVQLNDTLMKKALGRYTYTVASICDQKYGITNFVSNAASCTFDKIRTSKSFSSWIPGKIQLCINLLYESDNRPVENALLLINNKSPCYTGDGNYYLNISTWAPWLKIDGQLTYSGFVNDYFTNIYYCYGNIGIYVCLTIMSIFSSLSVARKRKIKLIEMKILESLESGGATAFSELSKKFDYSSSVISKITKKALEKGQISGVLTFDKARFISESELRLNTHLKDSSIDEIVRVIQKIKMPMTNSLDPRINSILSPIFRATTTLIDPDYPYIHSLDCEKLSLEGLSAPSLILIKPMKDTIFTKGVFRHECKGFNWSISKETIRQPSTFRHIHRLSKYLRCPGQGLLDLSRGYHRIGVHFDTPNIETHILKKETYAIEAYLKIQEKRFEVGKKILASTPRSILDFNPNLQPEEIISMAPSMFSDEERNRLNIINGVMIPKRPLQQMRNQREKGQAPTRKAGISYSYSKRKEPSFPERSIALVRDQQTKDFSTESDYLKISNQIIDKFINSKEALVEVQIANIDVYFLFNTIKENIRKRNIEHKITTDLLEKKIYLEKTDQISHRDNNNNRRHILHKIPAEMDSYKDTLILNEHLTEDSLALNTPIFVADIMFKGYCEDCGNFATLVYRNGLLLCSNCLYLRGLTEDKSNS